MQQQMATSSDLTTSIYHEKQKKQLCLLHALNNLFQREEFGRQELDEICEKFDDSKWFNAHRSWIGLGNYDANVLLCALQSRGLVGRWFDKRLSASRIRRDAIVAYVFNIPSAGFFIPILRGRHWFGPNYYNLDSKLACPTLINDDIVRYMDTLLAEGNELLLIVSPENEEQCLLDSEENMPS
uniref:ubiquitinyl hydrolase 1 n=1 Tax=Globodera pallida TaxID=36090 RepID=A0A183BLX4_GLOPA